MEILIFKIQIVNTVQVMKIGANIDESNEGDTTHLKQLMQLVI